MTKAELTQYRFELQIVYPGRRRKVIEVKDPVLALRDLSRRLVEFDFLWAECWMYRPADPDKPIRQWYLSVD